MRRILGIRIDWRSAAGSGAALLAILSHASDIFLCFAAAVPLLAASPPSSRDAERSWEVATGGIVNAPPVLHAGRVLVGSWDKRFYCIDAVSGAVQWSFQTQGLIGTVRAEIADSVVVFGSADSNLYALDLRDGRPRWTLATHAPFAHAYGATAADHVVYVGIGRGEVRALRAATGDLVWSARLRGRCFGRPAVVGEHLYVATFEEPQGDSLADGDVAALDRATGRVLWTRRLPSAAPYFGGSSNEICCADGVLFVGSNAGILYALEAATGRELWSRMFREPILTSCAVANGVVYVGSLDGTLAALDARTGDSKWSFKARGSIERGPIVARGDRVAFGASDSYVRVLDRKGVVILSLQGGFNPALDRGKVYYGAFDNATHEHFVACRPVPPSLSSHPRRSR